MSPHTLHTARVIFADQAPEVGHSLAASNCMFRYAGDTGDPDRLCLLCRGVEAEWLR